MRQIGHFIGGKQIAGTSGKFGDVFDPASGEVTGKVSMADASEVDTAVAAATVAWPAWAGSPRTCGSSGPPAVRWGPKRCWKPRRKR